MKTSGSAFQIRCQGETAIVTLLHDLGEFEFVKLQGEIEEALRFFDADPQIRNLVIDSEKSDYFGSAALGLLVDLSHRVQARGGHMALCHMSPHEQEILHITRLNTMWPMFATLDEALAFVEQPAQA